MKNITYISRDNERINERIIETSQLKALIDLSLECKQSFYYECTLAPLRTEDVDYAYWVGRDGKKNVYFTGRQNLDAKLFHPFDPQNLL